MTLGIVAAAANSLLDTLAGTIFHKLHTADPGVAGATAASVGDSSRKAATMASASGGSKAQTGTAGPWTNGGTSETISHLSHWDAVSAGNLKYTSALTVAQPWASGNTLTVTTHSISIGPLTA